ncbi:cell wall-binding repeat-containing protein [Herbiconiux sp. P15]|uniref:cell wall-binding repeat-containing protein n=1 Tax=Herbiconiux liukaitaii TaxID=3342799 RepID=UPI0035B81907
MELLTGPHTPTHATPIRSRRSGSRGSTIDGSQRRAVVSGTAVAAVIGSLAFASPATAIRPYSTPGITSVYLDSQFAYDIALSKDERSAYLPMLDGTVRVIDIASRTQKAKVAFTNGLNDPIASPDGTRMFFRDYWGHAVQVLDTKSNSAQSPIPLTTSPGTLDLIAGGTQLAAYSWDSLSLIDIATSAVTTIPVPQRLSGLSDVEYSTDGTVIYVLTSDTNSSPTRTGALTALRIDNGQQLWSAALPDGSLTMQTSPDHRTSYVGSPTGVTVVNLADGSSTTISDVPSGESALLSPDGSRLAILTTDHVLMTVDTRTLDVVSTTTLWDIGGIAFFTPSGSRVVVTQQDASTQEGFVVEVDIATGSIASTVAVGVATSAQAVMTRDGRTALFPGMYSADFIDYPRTSYAPGVARFNGYNRFDTSSAVAAEFHTVTTVYVTSGETFPDALGAAAVAGAEKAPLLLTRAADLPGEISWRIGDMFKPKVVIVGGPNAISPAVESQLSTLASSVERIAGADRYETARQLVNARFAPGSRPTNVYIATGTDYPDALSAATVAGSQGAPLVIVDGKSQGLDQATRNLLTGLGAQNYTIVGGPVAVTAGIERDLTSLAPVTRLAGADRYATSAALNAASFDHPHQAYLATGAGFADALAGSALAAAQGSPLYVTPPSCIAPDLADDLNDDALSLVKLLGGPNALGPGVESLTRC